MTDMRRQIQAEIEAANSQRAARSSRAGAKVATGGLAGTNPAPLEITQPPTLLADQQAKRAGRPQIYREPVVRGCCRALKAASLRQQAVGLLHLSLDDTEFVHLWFALSNARSKLRSAISRGKAEIGDLRATDSVWEKLAVVMNQRQRRRPA